MVEMNLSEAGNVLDLLDSEESRFRALDETGARWEKGMVATFTALGAASVGISASGSYLSGMYAVYPNAPLAGTGAALQAVPTLDLVTPGGVLSGGKAF